MRLTAGHGLCWTMCSVKMAWEREDWAFMLVLPTLRERAPRLRQSNVWWGGEKRRGREERGRGEGERRGGEERGRGEERGKGEGEYRREEEERVRQYHTLTHMYKHAHTSSSDSTRCSVAPATYIFPPGSSWMRNFLPYVMQNYKAGTTSGLVS